MRSSADNSVNHSFILAGLTDKSDKSVNYGFISSHDQGSVVTTPSHAGASYLHAGLDHAAISH